MRVIKSEGAVTEKNPFGIYLVENGYGECIHEVFRNGEWHIVGLVNDMFIQVLDEPSCGRRQTPHIAKPVPPWDRRYKRKK